MDARARRRADGLVVLSIGPAFLALALLLLLDSRPTPLPLRSLAEVRAEAERVQRTACLTTQPLRQCQTAPPSAVVNGFARDCQDCHRVFASREVTPRPLRQHQEIRMDHGLNDRCLNCHHPTNRNLLVLRDGSGLAFDHEEELCAQCHGTTYRDWQQGMHGKTLGFWSTALGTQRRLVCTECHDPHRPAFDSYAPLPGPQTFRMGEQHALARESSTVTRNPLRTWSRRAELQPPGEDHRRP